MNDITNEATDRFHKPSFSVGQKMLEFAPEPPQMIEAKGKGLKFTVGNKYPVVERKENFCGHMASYTFKTVDDKGNDVWIDEKYFIPAVTKLVHEDALGGFEAPQNDLLAEDRKIADDGLWDQPDIRLMA